MIKRHAALAAVLLVGIPTIVVWRRDARILPFLADRFGFVKNHHWRQDEAILGNAGYVFRCDAVMVPTDGRA